MQGRIKSEGACPNLLAEAGLYRYDESASQKRSEEPIGEYDHALDALRYLISRLDERGPARPSPIEPTDPQPSPTKKPDPWFRYDNEELWTRIF